MQAQESPRVIATIGNGRRSHEIRPDGYMTCRAGADRRFGSGVIRAVVPGPVSCPNCRRIMAREGR